MSMVEIDSARADADAVSNYLSEIVRETVQAITGELDKQMKRLSNGINDLSNNELWDIMMCISVEGYRIGIAKEQSSLKDACAEALYKESLAKSFNMAVGTNDARRNQSVIDSIDKQSVSILYSTVTGVLKTKYDEAHRMVSVINGILISRAAEAKLKSNPRSETDEINF